MTLREFIEAIEREAERALVGYPLDLNTELEIEGQVRTWDAAGNYHERKIGARSLRLERIGSRAILHFEDRD